MIDDLVLTRGQAVRLNCVPLLGNTRKSERLLPPGFASIPSGTETVSEHVKSYDTSQVIMKNGEPVTKIFDVAGRVERIVTNHTALISFNHNSQQFLVLAAWDDTFVMEEGVQGLNSLDFWTLSCKTRKQGLKTVLKPMQKVRLNLVPLFVKTMNPASIQYSSVGVFASTTDKLLTTPFNCPPITQIFEAE